MPGRRWNSHATTELAEGNLPLGQGTTWGKPQETRRADFGNLGHQDVGPEVSDRGINMLDLAIEKGRGFYFTGKLDYSVYEKPPSLWQPLRWTSSHGLHTHLAWPKMMVKRYHKLSSAASTARTGVDGFIMRMKTYGVPFFDGKNRSTPPPLPKTRTVRAVIPSRVVWRAADLPRILSRCFHKHECSLLAGMPNVGIAWRLGSQHLADVIRS